MSGVTKVTRTENGPAQFCRGGLEAGHQHEARTYTTLHYGETRRFHFCDEHPSDVLDAEGKPYEWVKPSLSWEGPEGDEWIASGGTKD